MKKIIAIDSGSSYMKSLTQGGRDRFPALARRIDDTFDHGDTVTVEDVRYVVGESALRTYTDDFATLDPNVHGGFHASAAQHAQMCYALQRLGAQGDYDALVLSLPYGDSQRRELKDALRARADYVWEDHRGKKRSVHFDAVNIMPQGVGALVLHEAQQRARPETMFMVDVGSCTIDEVALRYNAEKRSYLYLHDKSKSRRTLSIMAFYRKWLATLREQDGLQELQKGYFELMGMAIRGDYEMRYGTRTVDTKGAFLATRRWFTAALRQAIGEDMGSKLSAEVEQIVLTGGGAELVDFERLQAQDGRIVRLPVWANVQGQYMQACGEKKDASLYETVQAISAVVAR